MGVGEAGGTVLDFVVKLRFYIFVGFPTGVAGESEQGAVIPDAAELHDGRN